MQSVLLVISSNLLSVCKKSVIDTCIRTGYSLAQRYHEDTEYKEI